MNEVKRYLVPANGPDVQPVRKGFFLLSEICKKSKQPMNAILLIPTKRNIQGTSLEVALGKPISKTLLKGEEILLPNGGALKLSTARTFNEFSQVDIIIGVYVDEKILDQIDSVRNIKFVIVIPWIMQQVDRWMRTWNPNIIGETQSTPELKIENPIVKEALLLLTDRINLSTGLSHPRDRSSAIQLIQLLHQNHESFNPDSMRAWALRNSWSPTGANDLRDIAQAILNGKRLRTDSVSYWKSNIIIDLRERAKKNRY